MNVLHKSLIINIAAGISMAALAEAAASAFAGLFVGYDRELFEMTLHGVRIHALGFLPLGVSIYITTFFTAIGHGTLSSVISAIRSFVLPVGLVMILPSFFGIDGVWLSGPLTEAAGIGIALFLLVSKRKLFDVPSV